MCSIRTSRQHSDGFPLQLRITLYTRKTDKEVPMSSQMIIKPLMIGCALLGLSGAAVTTLAAPPHPQLPVTITDLEAKAKARFERLDSDANKSISLEEFKAVRGHDDMQADRRRLHGKKMAHKQAQHTPGPRGQAMQAAIANELFDLLDTDADGSLSRDEHAKSHAASTRHTARMRAMFKSLDADGSGELSEAELNRRLIHMRAADSNADGTITADELRALRQSHRQARDNQPG